MSPKPYARVLRGDEAPAVCVRDGEPIDLIDLGAEPIIGYGVVYLCANCANQLALNMGYVPKEIHEARLEGVRDELARTGAAMHDALSVAQLPVSIVEAELEGLSRELESLAGAAADRIRAAAARRPDSSGDLDGRVGAPHDAVVGERDAGGPLALAGAAVAVDDGLDASHAGDADGADAADTERALLAAAGFAPGAASVDRGADELGDEPPLGDAAADDVFELLAGRGAGGAAEDGDDGSGE